MRRARATAGASLERLRRGRTRASEALDRAAAAASPLLHRGGQTLAALPFRGETIAPEGLSGTLADLAAYTELPPDVVAELVLRRRPISFRNEWHSTPAPLRADHWFYLASQTYLFGNAPHFVLAGDVDAVARHLEPGSTVLDFGAGAGNLALGLAERGHRVLADDLNALQRDFLRYRVRRHDLEERVTVLDPWRPLERHSVDAVTAFDVLEHLPDGRATLDDRLLPALRPGGRLLEDSPFVRNLANPMHHDDWGLEEHLRAAGLAVHAVAGNTRVWIDGRSRA